MDEPIEEDAYVNNLYLDHGKQFDYNVYLPNKKYKHTPMRFIISINIYNMLTECFTGLTMYPDSSNMLSLFPNAGENSDAFLSKKEVSWYSDGDEYSCHDGCIALCHFATR